MEGSTINQEEKIVEDNTLQTAFCGKCGSKISVGTEICMNCGCKTQFAAQKISTSGKKKSNKKAIIVSAVVAVVLVAVIVVGLFIWNNIRKEQVKEQLAGESFTYLENTLYSFNEREYSFDDEGNCTFYYYYSSVMDEGVEYEKDYEIEFKDGMVFLVFPTDTLEVQYNKYGNIDGLYDITRDELYD